MKLAVAISNTGLLKTQMVLSLFRTLKNFPYEYTVLTKEGCAIHLNREILVETAIEQGYTHILFVDSDMVFDRDALLTLISRNKDIVGTNPHKRLFPLTSTAVFSPDDSGEDTVRCESLGAGFLIIKLDVFNKLSKPWFFWGPDGSGEDDWFCQKVKAAGYELWCDTSVKIGHIGDYIY